MTKKDVEFYLYEKRAHAHTLQFDSLFEWIEWVGFIWAAVTNKKNKTQQDQQHQPGPMTNAQR